MLDQGVRPNQNADYVEFWEAGSSAAGQFQCADCGYGVSVHVKLPTCPMCAGRSWERSPTALVSGWTQPL